MQHQRRHRALVALVAAALPLAAFGDIARLAWQHDGLNLTGFRVYAGTQPQFAAMSPVVQAGAALRTVDTTELADGVWYFALTAVNGGVESLPSNIACARLGAGAPCVMGPPLEPPGPVLNFTVTAIATPPPPATTLTLTQNGDLFGVTITGSAPVTLRLQPAGALIDWLKVGGQNGTNVPATPAVNNNGDGVTANSVIVTAPVVNAQMDTDGSDVTGITATVAGQTKPLVRTGTTWAVSFP